MGEIGGGLVVIKKTRRRFLDSPEAGLRFRRTDTKKSNSRFEACASKNSPAAIASVYPNLNKHTHEEPAQSMPPTWGRE